MPGLNAFSSGCECGVPIRGDCCILLYGDILGFPGLCKMALFAPGTGLCDINGLGECNGLHDGCNIGLLSGDCADICIIFDCDDDDGEGDINGLCGAMCAGGVFGCCV